MFTFEFESWNDIFLEHYLVSVLISIIVLIATLIISMRYRIPSEKKHSRKIVKSDNFAMKEQLSETMPSAPCLKKPALIAEKIIGANMTEEQRNHEYEVQQKQLAQIFELMQKQTDKFGKISLSEVKEQFKLYQ
ncbi:uncharacterized protein TNIN_172932 [Trichonephila inaurata madagascariensis]|uniref:Matrix-remodeling-associated protein 7 helical domain-containing protein n=1 Tax=Trichonephila inaurata madagascariensis TaxID=2747483 RepID=A0A8X6X4H5_9ARAC|nr:uncharacterized protein TNIN_172932 [Trichonephila inaurata madagascariensis]